MEKYFELDIITPNSVFYKGKAVRINCETTDGRYEILPNHAPTIAGLINTVTRFTDSSNKEFSVITGKGILKVNNNHVVLLCDDAKWKE